MNARRITYLALLLTAAVLHFAYGQYVTSYMLLFLLIVPVISVLLSLPAALTACTKLVGGEDVCRGRESHVRLLLECRGILPPESWSITVEAKNVFTGSTAASRKVRAGSVRNSEQLFTADTSQIGSLRYTIKRAFILDYLGLIPIPVKKGGSVSIIVLPDKEKPVPEPELVDNSARVLKPKPQGFSEEHELRSYHEGDPLNLVHWKLSSKYDEYIVREPQEILRREVVMIIDPPSQYQPHRSVLEQLCYLNDILAANQITYHVQYGKRSVIISSVNEFDDFIREVLSEPMRPDKAPSPDYSHDALIYRIMPGRRIGI